MELTKCLSSVSTFTELKRIASPYVIDYRGLSEEEITEAIRKTAPQYYYEPNVRAALEHIQMSGDRSLRIIGPHLIRHVVMQRDDCMSTKKATEEDIIKWEQGIIDQSNEDLLKKSSERTKELEFMQLKPRKIAHCRNCKKLQWSN